jgi:hypothetical protein
MWQKLALAAAACIPIIGCASGGPSSAPAPFPVPAVTTQVGQSSLFGSAASDYALVSIDGHRLPYAPPVASDVALPPTEVVSGALRLQANGAFVISTSYRELKGFDRRLFDTKFSGACAPDGDAFRMIWDEGGDTKLSISGDTVSVNNAGMLFQYLKRF